MKTKKHVFNFFTILFFGLTSFSIASCELNASSESLEYILSSDGASYIVSGIGNVTDKDIIIPSTYEDKPVTSIGWGAFKDCSKITSITNPSSITNIDPFAFNECSSLTNVVLPDGVTNIE